MRNIPLWWFIIMAWLLAMFGDNFWQFNVMELFATIAILLTAVIAVIKWRRGEIRRDSLIRFPNNWTAQCDTNRNVVCVQINVNALINFHAYEFAARISAAGKPIRLQNTDTGQPIANKDGRIFLTGEIPISDVPKGVTELQIQGHITLDGDIKKSSEKRTVAIANLGS